MVPAGWIGVGLKIAKFGITAFQMVEGSQTQAKGVGKSALAASFVHQLASGCECPDPADAKIQQLILKDSDVREAFNKYAEAYVNLQNIVAKKGGA